MQYLSTDRMLYHNREKRKEMLLLIVIETLSPENTDMLGLMDMRVVLVLNVAAVSCCM